MRKSSHATRVFGIPVVPPVSKTNTGLPASPFGIQRRTGPPRSHSSSNDPNRCKSSNDLTSRRGSQPALCANSSQKGDPVAGSKCQSTTSRTHASSAARGEETVATCPGIIDQLSTTKDTEDTEDKISFLLTGALG